MRKISKPYHSLRKKMIAFNLVTTVLALVFCGAVFVGSVWVIVGKYIERDLDFFLTETNNNLNTKTEYIENIIYQVRNSRELMNYMSNSGEEELPEEEREELEEVYKRVVDISSTKNIGGENKPIVEKVYLFHRSDDFLFTGYYAMLYSEAEENKTEVKEMYLNFREQKDKADGNQDYKFYRKDGNKMYLLFTVYDQNMEQIGDIAFEIRLDTLRKSMSKVNDYEQAFWVLYDQQGNILSGENSESAEKEIEKISEIHKQNPFEFYLDGVEYRLFTQNMSMNLISVIGIPKAQTSYLLYNSVNIYIVIIFIITFGVFVIFAYVIYRMTNPLKDFTEKLKSVKNGDFETKLPDYNTEEFQEISEIFNDMTTYVNNLINQVYEKQLSIKEMELKFLQSQMNPHFMFNVLNTIALQARIDQNEETYRMLTSFSNLIQAKIYRRDTEKVKISQELEYVEYYLYLQSYRYGDKLNYVIEVEDEKIKEMYIPKLCLQLIVENAVVHGIEPKMEPGVVEISIWEEEDSIYIEVNDNGMGFDQEGEILLPISERAAQKGHNRVGLNNAHHIIQLMYGEQYGIHIYSEKSQGSKITVHIPFDEEPKAVT